MWQSLDPCQGLLTSSTHENGNGDKGNQSWSFSKESAFVRGNNDDIVTTTALIVVEGSSVIFNKVLKTKFYMPNFST